MNCPRCKTQLHHHELAQPIVVLGRKVRPRSFCTTCCKQNLWPPSSHEALERLITGNHDPTQTEIVQDLTAEWGLPYTAALADTGDHIPPELLHDTEPPETK